MTTLDIIFICCMAFILGYVWWTIYEAVKE